MSPAALGLGLLVLALSAPPLQPLSSAFPPPLESRQQGTFTYWFEAYGLPPQQAEIVAAGFAREAEEEERLAAAARPEQADLIVRMAVSAAAVDLSLVDVLDGTILLERPVSCDLPLTRGSSAIAACLRTGFSRMVERMEEWTERAAAASETTADFGLSEVDRRSLDPADLARAYYREGLRASRAGFEDRALSLMAAAQPLFKETGLRREEGAAWEHLAYLMVVTNRGPDRAIVYAEQSIRIARELSAAAAETRALNLLAACEARTGNYTRAEQIARSAAARARGSADPLSEGTSLAILAGLAAVRGNFDQAQALQPEALALVRASGNAHAEARLLLAIATVTAQDDGRVHSASLAYLDEVRDRARELGDLALWRDVAFVMADTRFTSTDLALGLAGEVDGIRAFKLAHRLDDTIGEAAAVGLLGAFALRLQKPHLASAYFLQARDMARDADFLECESDVIQALGEIVVDLELGITLLREVADVRAQQQDLRGQIKTLSDLLRLQAGLERTDDAWESYRRAIAAVGEYVRQLQDNADREDIRAGLTTVLSFLVATETPLPFLVRHLRLNHMIPMPNPSWVER